MSNNGIEFYNNIFDNPDLIIDEINKYTWGNPGNVKKENRSNSVIYFKDKNEKIFNLINESISKYVKEYQNKYFLPELTYFIIEALRYKENEHYVKHYDNGSKHVAQRNTSCVIYLNDDYVGGEIEFVNFNIKVKPVKNSMVLFPSNYPYLHTAHKVTSGTKYAINLFMEYK